MFDQAVFNQGAFNVPFDDTLVFLQTDAYETVTGIFGLAVIAYLDTNANETVSNDSKISAGILLHADLSESITTVCNVIGTVNLITDAAEVIDKYLELGAAACLRTNVSENIQARVVLGAEYYLSNMLDEAVSGKMGIGCIAHPPGQDAYEIVTAVCDIEAQDIVELVIDITFAPGQTLVIDSANYEVLLDGENIVAKHSGGWVLLNRLVRSVQIDTGSMSALESSMLYTERWL